MLRVCGLLVALSMSAIVAAQTPSADPGIHFFSDGTIADGVYTNQCLGFSLPIPSGWEIRIHDGSLGDYWRNRSLPSPGYQLLILDLNPASSLPRRIALTEPTPFPKPPSAKDYVNTFVRDEVKAAGRELIYDAVEVKYGGQTFYRSDYKATYRDGKVLYFAFIYTLFRKRLIGESITAGSQAELDQSADSLQYMAFGEDQVDPKCVDGVMSGVTNGSSKSHSHPLLPALSSRKSPKRLGNPCWSSTSIRNIQSWPASLAFRAK